MPSAKIRILILSALLLAAALATVGIRGWFPDSEGYYSQWGQDKWVLEEAFPGETDGFFIDVGAWHATKSSNTKALENAGWDGICIEPFPVDWFNRRCQLFREVAYDKPGELIEFRTGGVYGGIDEHIGRHKEKVEVESVVELETTTIGDILERGNAPAYIHYLTIDTEGSEYEILSVFPFDKYTIGALTIEHNDEHEKRAKLRELLVSHGYELVKEELTDDYYLFKGNE